MMCVPWSSASWQFPSMPLSTRSTNSSSPIPRPSRKRRKRRSPRRGDRAEAPGGPETHRAAAVDLPSPAASICQSAPPCSAVPRDPRETEAAPARVGDRASTSKKKALLRQGAGALHDAAEESSYTVSYIPISDRFMTALVLRLKAAGGRARKLTAAEART
jgi:hypothetical protein